MLLPPAAIWEAESLLDSALANPELLILPAERRVPTTLETLAVVAVMVTDTVTECESVPATPVTVNVNVWGISAADTLTVMLEEAELPLGVTEAGLNDAVAPVGSPVAVRLTPDEKPPIGPTFTVADCEPPVGTVMAGMLPREKSITFKMKL